MNLVVAPCPLFDVQAPKNAHISASLTISLHDCNQMLVAHVLAKQSGGIWDHV